MAEPAYALNQPDSPWPPQGEWTWEDYLRLPEDGQRYEVIEGVLYVAPAPSFDHQFSTYELARRLGNFVTEHHWGLVLGAPFEVRLPGVANPVQPDLVFFRAGNEPRSGDKFYQGVPDLIVEVVSPGSVRLDRRIKLSAYERCGVPEYWLVDPRSRTIVVLCLDGRPRRYVEVGEFGVGDEVRSVTLTGFRTDVASLFPAR